MVLHASATGKRAEKLALEGNLTIDRAPELRQRLIRAIGENDLLTLDLSAVSSIDLACLQLLFSARRSAGIGAKRLHMVGTDNPEFARALQGNGFTLLDA